MATTPRFNLTLIDQNMTADVPRDFNRLAVEIETAVGNTLDGLSSKAADISLLDAGNYYPTDNVEAALQTVGQTLNGARGSLVASAQQLGVM